jgi:hypothetical protein
MSRNKEKNEIKITYFFFKKRKKQSLLIKPKYFVSDVLMSKSICFFFAALNNTGNICSTKAVLF